MLDKLQRVCRSRILREGRGIEIQQPRLGVYRHILQHRSEADRIPNLRLVLARQVYAPRVFSVKAAESKSSSLVSASIATFSSTVPKRIASQICGSFSRDKCMHLAYSP